MTRALLVELTDLFTREAFAADKRGEHDNADHLWDVSNELHDRRVRIDRSELTSGTGHKSRGRKESRT